MPQPSTILAHSKEFSIPLVPPILPYRSAVSESRTSPFVADAIVGALALWLIGIATATALLILINIMPNSAYAPFSSLLPLTQLVTFLFFVRRALQHRPGFLVGYLMMAIPLIAAAFMLGYFITIP